MSNLNLYGIEKDRIRENLNKYTRKCTVSDPFGPKRKFFCYDF